ncbi:ABC-type dipeptide/oligopeptide/nickel transport system ATPase subunit [Rheinheimera pacifica]|uniref:AAA family ATPase n=1 Tax=Rheinheimera pacifica TaxID=173990 RepID=UPI0021682828|nr:AAA family ATPase [Rheinheimera pacifica]MCS4307387.1 ABC-type dipeptide/oligopeptide/nickel transport system ATPase subunit [Rheinheimera pacifica]
MKITISVQNIQHIKKQKAVFDLSQNSIICITGKNSVGKTTLIRAIRNLAINSTFQETAAPYIFQKDSSITYSIDGFGKDIEFTYNRFIKGIDSKQDIPEDIKSKIKVELPIPHGERFNHFRRLADIDEELRAKIAIGDYTTSNELVIFLEKIYGDNRFEGLKQVEIKKTIYYFILKDDIDRFYIREDYFSSGEYFVINLFKQIQQGKKLIVIDEIDISLDASAQVNLVDALRTYCSQYETNIVFTTHSLALMKTLEDGELHYMEKEPGDGLISITPRSYNFVKSIMYGFIDFDKYILTEDACLANYINFLLGSAEFNMFYQYQVIYIGGATQVIDLMQRNITAKFLSEPENILAVLDGDQKGKDYLNGINNVIFLPFLNIELELYQRYVAGELAVSDIEEITNKKETDRAKNFYKQLTKKHFKIGSIMSEPEIYRYLEKLDPEGVQEFKRQLIEFLNPK